MKYQRSWEEQKAFMLGAIRKDHPAFQDVVGNEQVNAIIQSSWGYREKLYRTMHERFFPN